MIRLLAIAIAVLLAAGVAYVWVVPGALEQIGVEVVEEAPPPQPAKDDSRVTTPTMPASQPAETGETPDVGVLDPEALPFEIGCGLHLSREGEEDVVFIDALSGESNGGLPAAMIIDGTLVTFERTTADGELIGFGQYPRQVFDSADGNVRVVVEVDFGEATEPENMPVTSGELTVMKAGRPTLKFVVSGAAGC
jgi:hypothetical protein